MFSQIKRLGAETAVYGISTIIGRFLTFLLVPFYTNVLTTAQYGIVANVYSYIAFLNVLYSYGMESSFFRYAATLEVGDAKQNFSTPFISVAITSIIFSSLMVIFSLPLTHVFLIEENLSIILVYSAGILLFDTLAIVPFASLRLQQKPKFFATLKLVNIVSNVVFNVVSLLWLRWGVQGIFISGLASSVLTFLCIIPTIARQFTVKFSAPLYKSLLKFGLPYIPVGLSAMVLQVIDRPMLLAYTNDSTVGIYQANYRLGIFMNLVTSMFDYAWKPFFLSYMKEKNAKALFARILTYFLLGTCAIFLVLSFFISDLVKINVFGRHIIHPAYWGGLNVVPIVLAAYIFGGMSINFNAGIFIEKKTQYLLWTSGIAAASNIIANFLLIPTMSMMGAAYATLIAYAVGAIALYFVSHKFYPIHYEYGRLIKIAISTILVFGLETAVFTYESQSMIVKIIALCLWPIVLLSFGFLDHEELRKIKSLLHLSSI
jgi:O-antigen/teichoic acid export membrane protein